jgi:hypothetical protein
MFYEIQEKREAFKWPANFIYIKEKVRGLKGGIPGYIPMK